MCKVVKASGHELGSTRTEHHSVVSNAKDVLTAERKRHDDDMAMLVQQTIRSNKAAKVQYTEKAAGIKRKRESVTDKLQGLMQLALNEVLEDGM